MIKNFTSLRPQFFYLVLITNLNFVNDTDIFCDGGKEKRFFIFGLPRQLLPRINFIPACERNEETRI